MATAGDALRSAARVTARAMELAALPLFGVWVVGQVERDRTVATALAFYVPSLVVAAVLGIAWLRARRVGRPVRAMCWFVLGLLPAVFVVAVENQWTSSARASVAAPPSGTHRLVHWNVWCGLAGKRLVTRALAREHGDIDVISELPPNRPLDIVVPPVPGSISVARRWQLAVVARGRLEPGPLERRDGARLWPVIWIPERGGAVRLVVVDLPSALDQARGPSLAWLRERVVALAPDVVVGDFNAPRRSLGLSDLPSGYTHAYERVGAGYSATFPVPVPLWAIDQTVVGPRVEPLAYELQTPPGSDHRLQRFDFALRR